MMIWLQLLPRPLPPTTKTMTTNTTMTTFHHPLRRATHIYGKQVRQIKWLSFFLIRQALLNIRRLWAHRVGRCLKGSPRKKEEIRRGNYFKEVRRRYVDSYDDERRMKRQMCLGAGSNFGSPIVSLEVNDGEDLEDLEVDSSEVESSQQLTATEGFRRNNSTMSWTRLKWKIHSNHTMIKKHHHCLV